MSDRIVDRTKTMDARKSNELERYINDALTNLEIQMDESIKMIKTTRNYIKVILKRK